MFICYYTFMQVSRYCALSRIATFCRFAQAERFVMIGNFSGSLAGCRFDCFWRWGVLTRTLSDGPPMVPTLQSAAKCSVYRGAKMGLQCFECPLAVAFG